MFPVLISFKFLRRESNPGKNYVSFIQLQPTVVSVVHKLVSQYLLYIRLNDGITPTTVLAVLSPGWIPTWSLAVRGVDVHNTLLDRWVPHRSFPTRTYGIFF